MMSGARLTVTLHNRLLSGGGCWWQVRVRCIGAEGAGHSNWSSPVSVDTPPVPGLGASERPSATVASQVGNMPEDSYFAPESGPALERPG